MSRPWLRALAAWGVLCLLWTVSLPAPAVDTEPALPSAALQRRYENLTHQLRCLVCQDETIADSSASLAADFRALVHQQLLQGRSDAQIKAFMVARYGDYIRAVPLDPRRCAVGGAHGAPARPPARCAAAHAGGRLGVAA